MRFATLLYGRTSKDDKRKVTIDIQRSTLRRWAETDDAVSNVVGECWDDGVSGKIPLGARLGGRQVMALVRAGLAQCVAVCYADRFGRDLTDALVAVRELVSLGAKLVSVNEGWDARREDDPLFFQFMLMMAEQEYRRICQRLREGKARSIRENGTPPGGALAFGYRMGPKGEFVIDEREGAVVAEIFARTAAGRPTRETVAWLNTLGLPPGRKVQCRIPGSPVRFLRGQGSGLWKSGHVSRIIRSTVYQGIRRWGDKEFPVPRLVDQITAERAREVTASRKGAPRTADRGYLNGILRCSTCGGRYYAMTINRPAYRWEREHYRAITDGRKCHSKMLLTREVEADVWREIGRLMCNPTDLLKQTATADVEASKVKKHIIELDAEAGKEYQRLEEAGRAALANKYNGIGQPEWADAYMAECKQQQEEIVRNSTRQHQVASELLARRITVEQMTDLVARYRSLPVIPSQPQMRAVAEILIDRIAVTTTGCGKDKVATLTIHFKPPILQEVTLPSSRPAIGYSVNEEEE